jgi:hypothetical protein
MRVEKLIAGPTCVANAKTLAHGYVHPAAWNMGNILPEKKKRRRI